MIPNIGGLDVSQIYKSHFRYKVWVYFLLIWGSRDYRYVSEKIPTFLCHLSVTGLLRGEVFTRSARKRGSLIKVQTRDKKDKQKRASCGFTLGNTTKLPSDYAYPIFKVEKTPIRPFTTLSFSSISYKCRIFLHLSFILD